MNKGKETPSNGLKKSYRAKHALRNKKRLQASPHRLTDATYEKICDFCLSDLSNSTKALIMIMIITGRQLEHILSESVSYEVLASGVGKLGSTWRFTSPSSSIFTTLGKLEVSGDPFITIPPVLAKLLSYIRAARLELSDWESLIKDLLSGFRGPTAQLVTMNTLQRVIDFEYRAIGMPRLYRDFIANRKKRENMQSYYVAFRESDLRQHYLNFMGIFLPEVELAACAAEHFSDDLVFGSHRALDKPGVQALFQVIIGALQRAIDGGDSIRVHNYYQTYVVTYLQLATMHRPMKNVFRTIKHFHNDFSQVEIEDKSENSTRLVPLCESGRQVLAQYINYLKACRNRLRFINHAKYQAVCDMLSGTSNLFRIQTDSGFLDDFSQSEWGLDDPVFHKINWHRCTTATWIFQAGADSDALEAYMGHRQELDSPTSLYSTATYEQLLEISTHVDKFFKRFEVPQVRLPNIYHRRY